MKELKVKNCCAFLNAKSPTWNPVKELKDIIDPIVSQHDPLVESGEGIES